VVGPSRSARPPSLRTTKGSPPIYLLFARSKAKRSFRINKMIRKKAKSKTNQTGLSPYWELSKPFRIIRRENRCPTGDRNKPNQSHGAKPNRRYASEGSGRTWCPASLGLSHSCLIEIASKA
jgi:hypothetical protein